ncbi:AraC family transcriptional regulator [Amycolatopsis sp. YIM 10]|uniref:AraC family transcriptional regulator n=1 Tax=Amycolatopsis sp. YIM 10 TaxID=2653857 RepID=UPI0012A82BFE|nr:AraC family transcriptional regulator [Amycolatopsis sp. YIM 10]QFU85814.1 Transcriptional activator NphR [Amycolatopsis sp. YIM 10]
MTHPSSGDGAPVSAVYALEFNSAKGTAEGDVEQVAALLIGRAKVDGVLWGLRPSSARMRVRAGLGTAIGSGDYDLDRCIWHVNPDDEDGEWLLLSLCGTAERTVLVDRRRLIVPAGQLMVSTSSVAHSIVHNGRNEWWAIRVDAAAVHLPPRAVEELLFRPLPVGEVLTRLVVNTLPEHPADEPDDEIDAAGFDHYLTGLAELLLRSVGPRHGTARSGATRRHEVEQFILRHLADPGLSVTSVASAHAVSRRRLYQLFEDTGEGGGIAEFIRQSRMERARELLADPAHREDSIAQIAARCGFVNAAHFTRLFRDATGLPPGEYRRRRLAGD